MLVFVRVFYLGNTVMAFPCSLEECAPSQFMGFQVNLENKVSLCRVPTKHRLLI